MKYPLVKSQTVLVTGCSSGIGLSTARKLRGHGWTVIPTARKPEDLEMLRSARFFPVQLDLRDSKSIERAVAETLGMTRGFLGAVVNNAGYGQPGAMEDLSRDVMRQQFEANVFGLQELTNRLVPLFRNQRWGRIVNVSSVLGRIVTPFLGIYSASKFAVEAMSDALRVELTGSGVAVSVIQPGPIDTRFRQRSVEQANDTLDHSSSIFNKLYDYQIRRRSEYKKPTDPFTKPPEAVAKKIAHALESRHPRIRYRVTLPAYLGDWASRWLPDRLKDRLLASKVKRD
ncbi:MAG: SDR family NAD(P)-dependent oxidoreductase [Lentisphaerota bacterium]